MTDLRSSDTVARRSTPISDGRRKITAGPCWVEGRVFFSEEKKQKTFILCACMKVRAMASIVGAAEE